VATEHEPVEYVIEHLRDALARDPRANQLYVQVAIVHDKLFLTGFAGHESQRESVSEVAREVVPDLEVHNEMTVEAHGGAGSTEHLP
jgi:osmotically-inducible protein OsmY